MAKKINILAISYAKRVLHKGSREQKRMQCYADAVSQYSLIIFTRKKDMLPSRYVSGNLHVYGTNTHTRIGMLYEAYKIGKTILKNTKGSQWVVSSQDPFETSIVGRILAKNAHIPHHVQMHGDPFSSTIWKNESLLNRLRFIYGYFVTRQATAIRVVSKRAKESLIKMGVSKEKITVLPIQQDLQQYIEIGLHRTYEKKSTCTFIYVGRLSPEKNIHRIINVFARVYQDNKTVRLRIVGDGICRDRLHKQVARLCLVDVVSFIPWTENIPMELSQADVFVLASSHEGYGLVLIEAMATGLPIITTDVGCVGEVCIDGKDGIVVSFDDDDTFIKSMRSLAVDAKLRKRFGQHAHLTVLSQKLNQQKYIELWIQSFCKM